MFELEEISSVVNLQEKSYRLLKWVDSALTSNTVNFNYVHEAMSAARDGIVAGSPVETPSQRTPSRASPSIQGVRDIEFP